MIMRNGDMVRSRDFLNSVITEEIEGSVLLLARNRIIFPEKKIIVENPAGLSLSHYQPEAGENEVRTSTGIILLK
jgi:hypothetical protein